MRAHDGDNLIGGHAEAAQHGRRQCHDFRDDLGRRQSTNVQCDKHKQGFQQHGRGTNGPRHVHQDVLHLYRDQDLGVGWTTQDDVSNDVPDARRQARVLSEDDRCGRTQGGVDGHDTADPMEVADDGYLALG